MARYSKIVRSKKSAKPGFLPEAVKIFIARRVIETVAGVLVLAGLFTLLSIASYSHTDPSWNTATGAVGGIANWMGAPGAHLSDLLLQTIGMGAAVAGIVLTVWGVRVYKRWTLRPLWLRLTMLVTGMLAASAAFARLPAGQWLTHPWLGGSGGTLMLDRIAALFAPVAGVHAHSWAAALAAMAALACLLTACAIGRTTLVAAFHTFVHMARATALYLYGSAIAIYDWIRHYGDRDYQRPAPAKSQPAAKRRTPPRLTESPAGEAPAAAPAATAETEQQPAAHAIRIVSPKKSARDSGKQASFALPASAAAGEWSFPPLELLQDTPADAADSELDKPALEKNALMLRQVLNDFNINGDIAQIHPGPVVTLYELEPAPGTKSSRVIGLSDDIARSMSAVSVRCAVIPGQNVIGIELPNKRRQTVYMRDLLETQEAQSSKHKLPLILGKDIGGGPVIADLAKMPHLLVAGTTGSGKSVAVNTMILSLLYRLPPEKCRFIMIDPKMLELSVYQDIPHLLSPVVTEPGKAVVSLKWAVQEMENRYRAMSRLGVRNIDGYNARLAEARKKGETLMRKVQTGFDPETGKPVFEEQPMDMTELPYIVVIVDEFADLMLVAGKDVENAIQRLAQMARAAGIHLIMATQRPSVDVITGVIKANFPTRISFQVTSKIDSRTILGEGGAEQLLGMGDMLYMASGGMIKRVHGPFVSDEDVEQVVNYLKAQGEPAYLEDITEGGDFGDSEIMGALFGEGDGSGENSGDELYDRAVAIVARERKASTSFIQRHLQIGYNRAARIIEEMEKQGVIGPANHVGKREVLVGDVSEY